MENKELVEKLTSFLGEERVLINEPMSKHTSFKIGGPADIMFFPKSSTQLVEIIKNCITNGINYMIMGNGTNLLVSDKGIRGAVIKICDNMNHFEVKGEYIEAEAGLLISNASKIARQHSLTGLEFAEGIPGTIGGAVTMNAGAYIGEMSMVVCQTEYIDANGEVLTIKGEEHCFSYRNSLIQKTKGIVLKTKLKLRHGDSETIEVKMDEFNFKRRDKQPLEWPSAGSVFKRPEGHYVGKLIDDCGLRGYSIGGAQISDKHSGFIINKNAATCEDVLALIKYIQTTVKDKYKVQLEPEIRIIGDFDN